jgi:hypothetical protein
VWISDSAVLPVVPSRVNKFFINPIIQLKNPLISQVQTTTSDNTLEYNILFILEISEIKLMRFLNNIHRKVFNASRDRRPV